MNINKVIFKYAFEVVLLLLVIFVTYPVWQVLGVSKGSEVANYYDSYNFDHISMYVDKYANLENIIPISDADVDKSNYTSVNVVNNSRKNEKYKLILAIEKSSTLNTDGIKIEIDNSISFLEELYMSENNYVKFYLLDTDEINAKSIINKKILLWLDESVGNEEQNKTLAYNYQVVKKN